MTTLSITTMKRADDYVAHVTGDTKIWEASRSEAEAIGKLIITLAPTNENIELILGRLTMQLTTLAIYAAAAVIVAVALYGLAAEQVRLYRIRQRLDRRVRSLRRTK